MMSKDQVILKKYRCSGTSCPPLSTSSKAKNVKRKDHATRQHKNPGLSKQITPARNRSLTRNSQAGFEEGSWPPGCQNINRTHRLLDNSNHLRISSKAFQSQTAEWFVDESLAGQFESMDLVGAGDIGETLCGNEVGQLQAAHSTGSYRDDGEAQLCMENPFEIELLHKLIGAPKACLQQYIDKVCHVENELATAMKLEKTLYQDELQQILELTADFGRNLVNEQDADTTPQDLRRDLSCSEEEEIKFQLRIADVQLNFCLDDFEVPEAQESYARSTVVLLQRQAKCVKIIQLFRQLERRPLWTYRALMSLMEQLWCTSFAQLPTRFANLTALYDLALTITQLPAETSAFWMGIMPEDIKSYTLLFDIKPPYAVN
ncbi:hypothetical protein Esti_003968 [Eimeria stiedai]